MGGYTILELKNGHDIASHALTDAGIVWMETWYTQPAIDCGNRTPCTLHEYQPVSWALNLSTLDGATHDHHQARQRRRLAHQRRGRGSQPASAGDGRPGRPRGLRGPAPQRGGRAGGEPDRRPLAAGGDIVRTIDTTGYIEQLGVLGQALIYREGQDTAAAAGTVAWGDATLIAVGSDAEAPSVIEGHTCRCHHR